MSTDINEISQLSRPQEHHMLGVMQQHTGRRKTAFTKHELWSAVSLLRHDGLISLLGAIRQIVPSLYGDDRNDYTIPPLDQMEFLVNFAGRWDVDNPAITVIMRHPVLASFVMEYRFDPSTLEVTWVYRDNLPEPSVKTSRVQQAVVRRVYEDQTTYGKERRSIEL